ncbi:unnamed protein product, partial [Ectocarpus sp. 13 AM-2016]
ACWRRRKHVTPTVLPRCRTHRPPRAVTRRRRRQWPPALVRSNHRPSRPVLATAAAAASHRTTQSGTTPALMLLRPPESSRWKTAHCGPRRGRLTTTTGTPRTIEVKRRAPILLLLPPWLPGSSHSFAPGRIEARASSSSPPPPYSRAAAVSFPGPVLLPRYVLLESRVVPGGVSGGRGTPRSPKSGRGTGYPPSAAAGGGGNVFLLQSVG